MSTLEILTSVVTLLAVFTVFYVYTSIKISKQHNAIIEGYERLNNEYKRQINHFNMLSEDTNNQMAEINKSMKEDSYDKISSLSKRLDKHEQEMRAFIGKTNISLDIVEKNIRQGMNDRQNLYQQLRVLRENPNMTSQY